MGYSEAKYLALRLLRRRGKITMGDVRMDLGISDAEAFLKRMEGEGIIEPDPSTAGKLPVFCVWRFKGKK
jgi:hypothetical protein